jgi:hypothetical protein
MGYKRYRVKIRGWTLDFKNVSVLKISKNYLKN